jgi:hypothetical protein
MPPRPQPIRLKEESQSTLGRWLNAIQSSQMGAGLSCSRRSLHAARPDFATASAKESALLSSGKKESPGINLSRAFFDHPAVFGSS